MRTDLTLQCFELQLELFPVAHELIDLCHSIMLVAVQECVYHVIDKHKYHRENDDLPENIRFSAGVCEGEDVVSEQLCGYSGKTGHERDCDANIADEAGQEPGREMIGPG